MQYDHAKYPIIVGAEYIHETKHFSGTLESAELYLSINDAKIIIDGGMMRHNLNYSQFTKHWKLKEVQGTPTVRKPQNVAERILEASKHCREMIEKTGGRKYAEGELTIALDSETKKMCMECEEKTDLRENTTNSLKRYIDARFDILEKYIEENYTKIDRKH